MAVRCRSLDLATTYFMSSPRTIGLVPSREYLIRMETIISVPGSRACYGFSRSVFEDLALDEDSAWPARAAFREAMQQTDTCCNRTPATLAKVNRAPQMFDNLLQAIRLASSCLQPTKPSGGAPQLSTERLHGPFGGWFDCTWRSQIIFACTFVIRVRYLHMLHW